MIHRKRKSVTNSSDVVTKTRKLETEIDVDGETDGNSPRKNSKMETLRDAIDDAQIEIRQSIRDTIDSLSSDIEGKGRQELNPVASYKLTKSL